MPLADTQEGQQQRVQEVGSSGWSGDFSQFSDYLASQVAGQDAASQPSEEQISLPSGGSNPISLPSMDANVVQGTNVPSWVLGTRYDPGWGMGEGETGWRIGMAQDRRAATNVSGPKVWSNEWARTLDAERLQPTINPTAQAQMIDAERMQKAQSGFDGKQYYNLVPGSQTYTTSPYNIWQTKDNKYLVNDSSRVDNRDTWVKQSVPVGQEPGWQKDDNGNYHWIAPGMENMSFDSWKYNINTGKYEFVSNPWTITRNLPDTIIGQQQRLAQAQVPRIDKKKDGGGGNTKKSSLFASGGGGGRGGGYARSSSSSGGSGGGYSSSAAPWFLNLVNWNIGKA